MLVPQGTPSAEDSLVVAKVRTKSKPPNKIKKKEESNHKKVEEQAKKQQERAKNRSETNKSADSDPGAEQE